MPVPFGCLLT